MRVWGWKRRKGGEPSYLRTQQRQTNGQTEQAGNRRQTEKDRHGQGVKRDEKKKVKVRWKETRYVGSSSGRGRAKRRGRARSPTSRRKRKRRWRWRWRRRGMV